MRNVVAALLVCALYAPLAAALEPFVIKDIRVEGLQRIAAGTVFNYLPVKIGETLNDARAQEAIRALFKTGFFRDVELGREGGVLVVRVVERPAIASIKISGSKEISENDLKKSLRDIGFVEGRVFSPSLLEQIEQELRRQYFARGRYAVRIQAKVTPEERNRVSVEIDISEGRTARIQEIKIVGSSQFPEKDLLKLFSLRTKGGLFGKRNQYSRQQLVGDLEKLRSFYQDRGFLEFDIASTQVSITPDKEQIYITINASEGQKYRIADVKLAGKLVLPEPELRSLITVKPGDVFSRRLVTEITKAIMDRLGNEGYAFANVNAIPDLNKEKATVAFTFFVDPGKRVYVRRVNFAGNSATRDNVLRREMRQLEGAWFSAEKITRSRERLQRTGFFEEVTIETPPVPGTTDQVDINVTVKERLTGNLLFGAGFSDAEGVVLSGSITESNLFGTGKELSVSLNTSQSHRLLSIRYLNPYWTRAGISRGLRLFFSDIDTTETSVAPYEVDTRGIGLFFGLPISETRRVRLGLDFDRTEIGLTSTPSQVAIDFIAENGETNDVLKGTLGWSQDSLDSAFFPTRGGLQSITGEIAIPGSDLEYYKLSYLGQRYWRTTARTSFRVKAELGQGDGYGDTTQLPFYENFFAGGATSVRGYEARTLGPRDTLTGDAIGGDRRVLGNLEWFFPVPGQSQNKAMRMSLFVDGGWVWGPGQHVDLAELRYSTGLAFNWLSPVGPLAISIAAPLNDKEGDETETVQFTLGAQLR